MRSVAQEAATFVQCFVDELEIAVFQVTQTAVNELRRKTARAGSEITLVDQGDAQAAQHGIERDAGTGDAAAENEQIENSVRERFRRPFHTHSPARPVSSLTHAAAPSWD